MFLWEGRALFLTQWTRLALQQITDRSTFTCYQIVLFRFHIFFVVCRDGSLRPIFVHSNFNQQMIFPPTHVLELLLMSRVIFHIQPTFNRFHPRGRCNHCIIQCFQQWLMLHRNMWCHDGATVFKQLQLKLVQFRDSPIVSKWKFKGVSRFLFLRQHLLHVMSLFQQWHHVHCYCFKIDIDL